MIKLTDVYRIIAGHSDYHGDDILAALTCIAEGKEVGPVRPIKNKHGKWIIENKDSIRCPNCCFNRASIKMPMDYCPNCGLKMY